MKALRINGNENGCTIQGHYKGFNLSSAEFFGRVIVGNLPMNKKMAKKELIKIKSKFFDEVLINGVSLEYYTV